MGQSVDGRKPIVLFDFPDARDTRNQYTTLTLNAIAPYVSAETFNWRTALFGRYDIVHLNWPEGLVRDTSGIKALAKHVLSAWLLTRASLRRIPVVRTVHNLRPHASRSWSERLILGWIDRATKISVYLNESPENDRDAGVVILHGLYPPPPEHRGGATIQRRDAVSVLTFGLLRPFKGIEQAIRAVDELKDPWLRYTVAGSASDRPYADNLRQLVARVPRVQLREGFLSDSELDSLIAESDLVALPYRYMYNSGAAILALSRGRHVLVPDSPATRTLAKEVGGQWVTLFAQPLTPSDMSSAIKAARVTQGGLDRPDLSRRSWETIGALHCELYSAVLRHARSGNRHDTRAAIRADLGGRGLFVDHSALNALDGLPAR